MKTKFRQISKRSLSMILAVLMMISIVTVGTISANAGTPFYDYGGTTKIYIYYNDTYSALRNLSGFSHMYFVIAHNTYYRRIEMTNVSNTALYRCTVTSKFSDATMIWVMATNNTWSGNKEESVTSPANTTVWGWSGVLGHTNVYNSNYNFNTSNASNGHTYYLKTTSSATKTISISDLSTGDNYSTLKGGNSGVTYKTQLASAGSSSYSNSTATGIATINLNTGYWASSTSVTLSDASSDAGSTSYNNAALAAKSTLSYSSLGSNYEFVGFYQGTSSTGGTMTALATSGTSVTVYPQTYTGSATQNQYYFARFRTKPKVTLSQSGGTGTVTIGGSTVTSSTYVSTGTNTAVTIAAPANKRIASVSGAGWSATNTSSNTSWTGTINTSSNATLTITYEANTYNLSFSQPSNGSIKYNNSTTSPVAINYGSSASVVVTPNDGYKISQLTDNGSAVTAAANQTSAYTHTISSFTAAHTIAATMAARTYTVSCTGSNVTYTTNPTSGTYGNTVSFVVTASDPYVLGETTATYVDKNGATQTLTLTGSNGSYSFTQPAGNVTIVTTAVKTPRTVTVTKGTGVDSYVVNGATYTANHDFTVSDGDSFTITSVNYSTGYENNNNTLSIASVTSNQTINLTGKKTSYSITKAATTNGSFTVNKDTSVVTSANYGDTITITPSPTNSNYVVDTVSYNDGSDHTINYNSGYSFTMPAHNVTVTVTFKEAKYTVTVQSESTTKGTVASSSVSAGNVTWVSLPVATANTGYTFKEWKITSGTGTLNNASSATQGAIKASTACTVKAYFQETMNAITVQPEYCGAEPLGTVSPVSGSAGVATSLSVSATARTGYEFVNWTSSNSKLTFASSTSASTSLTASGADTATANYKPTKLYLDISGNTSWRNQTIKIYYFSNDSAYNTGTSNGFVTMTAVAGETDLYVGDIPSGFYENKTGSWGFIFLYGDWVKQTGNLQFDGKKNRYAVTSTLISGESKKYTGSWNTDAFILETKYNVTVNSGAGGTVTYNTTNTIAANGSDTVSVGATARSLVATPQAGYHFVSWSTTGGASVASTTSASTTITATDTGTVTATFAQDVYTVTLSGSNCTLNTYSNSGMTTSQTQFNYNNTVYYKLTPASGYRITSIKIGSDSAQPQTDTGEKSGSFTITGNTTITVTTVQIYTVTLVRKFNSSTSDTPFSKKQYKLGSGGTYADYTGELTVDAGTEVYFKVTYATGFKYKSKSSNLTIFTNYTEFKTSAISADTTVTITGQRKTYTLSGAVSPSHGTVTFYSDSACTTSITSASYNVAFYAKYTPADGYTLNSFTTSDANISATSGNVATCKVTSTYADKTTVTITANVALEHTVNYYVDMHNDQSSVQSIGLYSNSTATTALQYNNNGTLTNCVGTASQQGTSTVYAAEIRTPLTSTGSGFSPIYAKITYKLTPSGSSATKIVTLDSSTLTAINSNSEKSVWMEASKDASVELSKTYSTNSTPAVSSTMKRIYIKKPYNWQNTTDGQKFTNMGLYHWGDYTDIGWTNSVAITYMGYDSATSTGYHYYYVDIPKEAKYVIVQGWGSNTSLGGDANKIAAQTEDIELTNTNYIELSQNGNSFIGTMQTTAAKTPDYTRYISAVTMNKNESTTVNITPTNTARYITYTSSNTGVVTVNSSGVLTPVAKGTATITVEVYSTAGYEASSNPASGWPDRRTYTCSVTIKDPSVLGDFKIMSLATRTSTISIPQVDSNQPGYFDSAPSVTVTGIPTASTSGFTNSAIVTATATTSVSGAAKGITYTVKYAAPNNTFTGYSGITVTAAEVTSKSIHYNDSARYGYKEWQINGTKDDTLSGKTTKSVTGGIETAVTKNFELTGTTYSEIFESYTYVDVTFNFDYYEYKTLRTVNKKDAEGNDIPILDGSGNPTGAFETEEKNFYYYDPDWVGNDDRTKAAFDASKHNLKTYTETGFEVRGKTATAISASGYDKSQLVGDAGDAIENMPVNNYYDYRIDSSTIKTITKNGTYTATIKVELKHTPKKYHVYRNGVDANNSDTSSPNYGHNDYYYQEYANLTNNTSLNWILTDSGESYTGPTMYTGNTYKFRVTGDTYLKTTAGSISDREFNRSRVALAKQEVNYEAKSSTNSTIVEKLTNDFYIADFFDPAKVLKDDRDVPEDDVTFVGGGVVYYRDNGGTQKDNSGNYVAGTPDPKTVDGGYVNGTTGLADADAVSNFIKGKIEAALNDSTKVPTEIQGDDDRKEIAYGTEIPAAADTESGLRYRYLPYNTFKRDSSGKLLTGTESEVVGKNLIQQILNNVPQTTTVEGETVPLYYTFAKDKQDNTYRYSNALKAYQYIFASKQENKAANEGKDMRLYAYYIYSYTKYDDNVPHTEYKVVLSDQPANATTYFSNPNTTS